MSLITSMLRQKAVYWPPGSEGSGGQDFDDYGQPVYADAVEIDCRWEDVAEEFIGPDGTREISRSVVYVDRDVQPGGMLWLGLIADVEDIENPRLNDGAWEIRRFDRLPNLRNTETLRMAYL